MAILTVLGIWLLKLLGVIIILVLIASLYGFLVRPDFVPYAVRYGPLRAVVFFLCFICGVDIEVIGQENLPNTKGKRGYVVVANHQSNWDPAVLLVVMRDPMSFVAKKEIYYVPVLGTWARTLHCPFIDRKNLRQSYNAVMIEGTNNIKKGLAMIIFPAGTRSKSNEVIDFKAGSFKMATEVGAPILPITLENFYKAKNGNFFKRTKVKVHIHPWIEKAEYEQMSSFELAKQTQTLISEALPER